MLLDGKCPNENWKYNTTLCQKVLADGNFRPDLTGTYCCELEVPGAFENDIIDWDRYTDECFAKNDDHVAERLVNGYHKYDSESVLCVLKPINQ